MIRFTVWEFTVIFNIHQFYYKVKETLPESVYKGHEIQSKQLGNVHMLSKYVVMI